MWLVLIGGFFIFSFIVGIIKTYEKEVPAGIHNKASYWLQEAKNLFNHTSKRLQKCGYPYLNYLEALGIAQEKGYINEITEEEINFYLSFPKRYDIIDKKLYVNGVNLGPLKDCVLFRFDFNCPFAEEYNNPIGTDSKITHFTENHGNTIYIEDFKLNDNFNYINPITDAKAEHAVYLKKNINKYKEYYKILEKDGKEILDKYKHLITKDLQSFLDKLQEKDWTRDEMKELYKENNKKWQDRFFSTHEEYKKGFLEDYDPNMTYDAYYNRRFDPFKLAGLHKGDRFLKDEAPRSKELWRYQDDNRNYRISPKPMNEVFQNVIKNIELEYDLKEFEPDINHDYEVGVGRFAL